MKLSRLLDITIHVGVVALAIVDASIDAQRLLAPLVLPAVMVLLLLPFRGSQGHYYASVVDFLAAAGALLAAAGELIAIWRPDPEFDGPKSADFPVFLAYAVLALAGAVTIERNRHGSLSLRTLLHTADWHW